MRDIRGSRNTLMLRTSYKQCPQGEPRLTKASKQPDDDDELILGTKKGRTEGGGRGGRIGGGRCDGGLRFGDERVSQVGGTLGDESVRVTQFAVPLFTVI